MPISNLRGSTGAMVRVAPYIEPVNRISLGRGINEGSIYIILLTYFLIKQNCVLLELVHLFFRIGGTTVIYKITRPCMCNYVLISQ